MTLKQEFREHQVTTIRFAVSALDELRNLYRQIGENALPRSVRIGRKDHQDRDVYGGFGAVKMRWYSANSVAAMRIFRRVLDGSCLAKVRDIVGERRDRVRVVQAHIIEIEGSYPPSPWHSDFTDKELGLHRSATVLAPLFTFQRNFGGLEMSVVERGMPLDFDRFAHVYRYRDGEAVLFDGVGMVHRTQSYRAKANARRVLACWQLADTSRALRPALLRIGKRNGDRMFFLPHVQS
jgi:hypothetical protein